MASTVPTRVPISTYRLQLNGNFTFGDATRLAPYLSRLGITDCYCSPILAARGGSVHGYDVCDHSQISSDLGGEAGLRSFAAALQAHDLGLILDIVPNHMSADPAGNLWWRSVLENGPSSPFARFFDIDWAPVKSELHGKVLLPVLGEQYGATLDNGLLQIAAEEGTLSLRYHDLDLPLNPRELRRLLRHDFETLRAPGDEDPDVVELQSILFHLDHLPLYTDTRENMMASRGREKEVAKHRLKQLFDASPRIRRHVLDNVRRFNGLPGDPRSFDLLHDLLEQQAYRLSSWRTAMHEINYRRFFDVNELVSIRVEEREVFDRTHEITTALVREGHVHGVRIDHVDGLFDPAEYLERLAAAAGAQAIYVVAEKILSAGEPLRTDWKLHGTTGYDFLNDVNGLFVDRGHAHDFLRLYARFTGQDDAFADVAYESKKLVIASSMAGELNVLAHELNRISESDRSSRDFTLDSLQEALREVVACFPVYRTYYRPAGCSPFDEHVVEAAVSEALERNPAAEPTIYRFIREMLLPTPAAESGGDNWRRTQFAMKFQQYTGPVHAKGVEDTAFYRYIPLLSLNEVGGHPTEFGRLPEDFHKANLDRLHRWPLSMLATSTHDSKRGEDARARLNVLSEIPRRWRAVISRWARATASARTVVRGEPAPRRIDEYLFYQALLGAWPAGAVDAPDALFVERMRAYMQKAVREAKRHSSWINPDQAYDDAVSQFVERVLAGPHARVFLPLFLPFARRIARLGAVNSLSQLLLKVGSPGVPDFYQGTEMWDLALVDPDNRQPVEFERRAGWLEQMGFGLGPEGSLYPASIGDLSERWEDGRVKLAFTAASLRLRRRWPDIFLSGSYLPLPAVGAAAAHLVGFARILEARSVVVLAPRLVRTLYGSGTSLVASATAWKDTYVGLPPETRGIRYRSALTGEHVPVREMNGELRLHAADALRTVPANMLFGEREVSSHEATR